MVRMMGKILDLIIKCLDVGERQYIATMETMDREEFTVTVTAYSTEDALMKIENYTANGCTMTDIRIIDENGNIF
jgi:hypothetical protein